MGVFAGTDATGTSSCTYYGSLYGTYLSRTSSGTLTCYGAASVSGWVYVSYSGAAWTMSGSATVNGNGHSVTGAGPAAANGTLYFG